MRAARVLAPVYALGPGKRVCLWVQGCGRGCPGCIAPELQPAVGPETDEALLAELLTQTAAASGCRGLTVSGGEPFDQAEALLRLLALVRPRFEDILVYTGFLLEELRRGRASGDCLKYLDVLIDGPYRREENRPEYGLRGSGNQRIWVLTPSLAGRYEAYLRQGRTLESFSHDHAVLIVGIPDRRDEL